MDFTPFFEKNTIQSQFREKWKYEILGQIELKKHEDFDKLAKNCEIFGKTNKINFEGFGIFCIFTRLSPRKSVIIFDEVQECPLARQAIKKLVKDHRYDYIETGSLISIKKKKTKNIRIPSEETCIQWITRNSAGLWATPLR